MTNGVGALSGGGIRVTMITGDHKITAAAIAMMLGIGDGKTAVTGGEIEGMDSAALQECVRGVDVFARAEPTKTMRQMPKPVTTQTPVRSPVSARETRTLRASPEPQCPNSGRVSGRSSTLAGALTKPSVSQRRERSPCH